MRCTLTQKAGTLPRSLLVGLVATAVDLTALWGLVAGLGLSPQVANIPALLFGLGVQFVGNKYFAFRDYSARLVAQGSRFALVELLALGLNAAIFHVLVSATALPYLPARLLVEGLVYLGLSYPLWRLIFAPRRPDDRSPVGAVEEVLR